MNSNMTLSDFDIFCGNTFITTIDQFDSINIEIDGNRLFVNKTFVKNFEDHENAIMCLQPLIESLEEAVIDYDLDIK